MISTCRAHSWRPQFSTFLRINLHIYRPSSYRPIVKIWRWLNLRKMRYELLTAEIWCVATGSWSVCAKQGLIFCITISTKNTCITSLMSWLPIPLMSDECSHGGKLGTRGESYVELSWLNSQEVEGRNPRLGGFLSQSAASDCVTVTRQVPVNVTFGHTFC